MKQNQISATIPAENLTKAHAYVDEIEKLFPFLLSLTPEEKQGGFKLGDINVGFLSKTKEYMTQAPQFIPSFINTEETSRDVNIATELFNYIKKLGVMYSKIEDTAAQAGFEALSSALAYYNSVKLAAKNNVPGAKPIYDDLRKRFPGRPNQAVPETEAK